MQFLHVRGLGREHAQAQHFIFLAGAHEAHHVAQFHPAVHHAEEHHHALVAVVPGVEDQGLEGGVQIAARRGQTIDDGFQHGVHAQTGHGQGVGAVQADGFLDLFLDAIHLGAGQVDLVQHGHDLVVVVQGQIDVGQGLGLHALGGVHHQQRAFAGGQGTRYFVVEVHVSGRVDEVQLIFLSVGSHIGDAHGLRLDGDAALAFQIHLVQVLLAGLALADDLGQLKDAVGKGGLAVVDMGDDAEIANMIQTGHGISCIGLRRLKSILISQNRAKVHAARPCPPGGRGEGACPGNGVVRNRSRTGRSHAGGVTACMRYRGSRPLLPGRAPGPRRTAVPACRRGSRWNRWR